MYATRLTNRIRLPVCPPTQLPTNCASEKNCRDRRCSSWRDTRDMCYMSHPSRPCVLLPTSPQTAHRREVDNDRCSSCRDIRDNNINLADTCMGWSPNNLSPYQFLLRKSTRIVTATDGNDNDSINFECVIVTMVMRRQWDCVTTITDCWTAVGPRQHSDSSLRVPRDSWPYFLSGGSGTIQKNVPITAQTPNVLQ
jgi:hypothetical protein